MRVLAILTLPIFLGGCGVPLAISAVGYVADGLSASASGKTINDHFVSQLMNMDCGLLRFLDGDWICRQRGVDPDDDTLYLADGRTMEGPPRPWGTSAEPDLQYDDGLEYDARGWADGAEIAVDTAGDDPGGEMLAAIYEVDDGGTQVAHIGDMSKAREREEGYRAVAERVRFAQALQLQYQQAARGPYAGSRTADGQPGQTSANAGSSSMYFLENLTFSAAFGLDWGYSSTSPTMVAALAGLQSAPSARPYQVASVSGYSANALGLATYGLAAVEANQPVIAAYVPPRQPTPVPIVETAEIVAPVTLPRLRDRDWRLTAADTDAYLVVGSFREQSNATTAAALRQDADVTVVESAVQGRTFYRLVAGPFEAAKVDSARRALRIAGYSDSWTISLCGSSSADSQGCLTDTQVAALGETDDTPPTIQLAGLND